MIKFIKNFFADPYPRRWTIKNVVDIILDMGGNPYNYFPEADHGIVDQRINEWGA